MALDYKEITELFNEISQEYAKELPDILENYTFFIDGQLATASKGLIENFSKEIKHFYDYVANKHYSFATKGKLAGKELNILNIHSTQSLNLKLDSKDSDLMNSTFIIDHEIGHLVVKGGFSQTISLNQQWLKDGKMVEERHQDPLVEIKADAFAILRHIQRFGPNTNIAEAVSDTRIKNFFNYEDSGHLTSSVCEKIDEIVKEGKIDIKSLSIRETAELADKLGNETNLLRMDTVRDEFRPAIDCYENQSVGNITAVVLETFKVINANLADETIYNVGKLFIKHLHKNYYGSQTIVNECFDKANKLMQGFEQKTGCSTTLIAAVEKEKAELEKKKSFIAQVKLN